MYLYPDFTNCEKFYPSSKYEIIKGRLEQIHICDCFSIYKFTKENNNIIYILHYDDDNNKKNINNNLQIFYLNYIPLIEKQIGLKLIVNNTEYQILFCEKDGQFFYPNEKNLTNNCIDIIKAKYTENIIKSKYHDLLFATDIEDEKFYTCIENIYRGCDSVEDYNYISEVLDKYINSIG